MSVGSRLVVLVTLVASLASVSAAQAAAPTGLNVTANGDIVSASWKLPAGTKTGWLEFAPTTTSDSSGAYTDAAAMPIQYYDGQTAFKATKPFPNGTWYAHVSAVSAKCDDIEVECVNDWSPPVVFTVPGTGPPPSTARFTSLEVARKQKLKRLVVRATLAASGTVTVGGALSVPNASKVYKLKPVSVPATAGKAVTVVVKLPKKALKAARRALRARRKVKARLTITARDAAGATKTEKRSVTLRR
jgi:hypothetical protein